MSKKLDKLIELGFEDVGTWSLLKGKLQHNLTKGRKVKEVLYSFVIETEIKYIGKTSSKIELQRRLYGYINPGPTQNTNIKNNKNIKEKLKEGKEIKIYAFLLKEELEYKGVKINLAAALEDSLINEIKPEWNNLGKKIGELLIQKRDSCLRKNDKKKAQECLK